MPPTYTGTNLQNFRLKGSTPIEATTSPALYMVCQKRYGPFGTETYVRALRTARQSAGRVLCQHMLTHVDASNKVQKSPTYGKP